MLENTQNAANAKRLPDEREQTKEDFENLCNERERYRAKFENMKQLYEYESQRNQQFRVEQEEKLKAIESEKQ